MFSLHDFVMKGITGMVGHVADYKVIEYATAWFTRGTLTEKDLEYIDKMIEKLKPEMEG